MDWLGGSTPGAVTPGGRGVGERAARATFLLLRGVGSSLLVILYILISGLYRRGKNSLQSIK
jgi:hypothetical protein